MNKLGAYTSSILKQTKFFQKNIRPLQQFLYSTSSDEENQARKSEEAKKRSEAALNKLNELLKKMVTEDTLEAKSELKLSRPKDKRKIRGDTAAETVKSKAEVEQDMVKAVKDVAKSIGGDIKQTESELLLKLLQPGGEKEPSLTDVVKGMKIERESPQVATRAHLIHHLKERAASKTVGRQRPLRPTEGSQTEIVVEKIDLFGVDKLGIFTGDLSDAVEGPVNETWNNLYERELKLTVTQPPRNYFQQMILWTEQGKVWKFPIDNEQGMEEEQNVSFTEHIFLEKYLEPWCPSKGPLRHFMELVCVGLSKNPYLTVEAKKEHIEWFKNYFEEKKQLLTEVGALQDNLIDVTKQIQP